MKSWHLPIDLSAQIAPDYISEYLDFQNFPGGMSPDPLSISRLGLFLWALTRPYFISPEYAPPTLTNKKCLGTPLIFTGQYRLFFSANLPALVPSAAETNNSTLADYPLLSFVESKNVSKIRWSLIKGKTSAFKITLNSDFNKKNEVQYRKKNSQNS